MRCNACGAELQVSTSDLKLCQDCQEWFHFDDYDYEED